MKNPGRFASVAVSVIVNGDRTRKTELHAKFRIEIECFFYRTEVYT